MVDMTVSEQIIQVLDELCKRFGLIIDWTNENAIPYMTVLCEKLVNYEIITSIVYIVFSLALIAGSIIGIKKFAPTFKKGLEYDEKNYGCGWTLATIFVIITLIIINIFAFLIVGSEIMDVIKCITFPEMYVFEYIRSIM